MPAGRSPTSAQREALGARSAELVAWLSPPPAQSIRVEVAALFGVMASRGGDEIDLRARLEIYVADLASLPMFALRAAFHAYRTGRLGDGKWLPTPGELRIAAEGYARHLVDEQAKIRKVLTAQIIPDPVVSPERKAATLAMVRATVEEMRANEPTRLPRDSRLPTKLEAEAALELHAIAPKPLPPMSDDLRRKLGVGE